MSTTAASYTDPAAPVLSFDDTNEANVLSCMMNDPDNAGWAASTAAGALTPEDFAGEGHAELFRWLVEEHRAARPVDASTLRGRLPVGLDETFAAVITSTMPAALLRDCCGIVRTASIKRQIARLSHTYAASDPADPETSKTVAEIQSLRDELVGNKLEADTASDLEAAIQAAFDPDADKGLRFGLEDLDDVVGPLQPGHQIVIAGRTSMGKSTVMRHLAIRQLQLGGHVLFFTLEIDQKTVLQQMLALMAGLPLRFDRNAANEERLNVAARMILEAGADLTVRDVSQIATVEEMCAQVREANEKRHVDLILSDYLQIVRSSQKSENRQLEVASVSVALKQLAVEVGALHVTGAQVNRQADSRGGLPQLSDLRESGSIEQDADKVIFIDRPHKDDEDSDDDRIDFSVAKNRQGETGRVRNYVFRPEYGFIENRRHKDF